MGTRKRIVPSRYSPEPSTSQLLRLPECPNLVMAEGSGPNSCVNFTAAVTTPTHSSPLLQNSSATFYERTPVSHRNDNIPYTYIVCHSFPCTLLYAYTFFQGDSSADRNKMREDVTLIKHMLVNLMSGMEELLKRGNEPAKPVRKQKILKTPFSTWESFLNFETTLLEEESYNDFVLLCFNVL